MHWIHHLGWEDPPQEWTPLNVQTMEEVYLDKKTLTNVSIGNPTTLILERCTCGATRAREIKGEWSLEDLKRT